MRVVFEEAGDGAWLLLSEVVAKDGGCGELESDELACSCKLCWSKTASGRDVVGSTEKGASFRFFCEDAVLK